MQKLRVRFAKRGRLRFASHRDFQRSFERALRRAHVPMAYSHGFTPHPKISFAGAAPTGAASEAEYLEISLTEQRRPEDVRAALDAALPPGLDIVAVAEVASTGGAALADELAASVWLIELPDVDPAVARAAVEALVAAPTVEVERRTKKGVRTIDTRGAVLRAEFDESGPVPAVRCVLEHQTPTVRPEEVLAGLRVVAGFEPSAPPRSTRLAQGAWDDDRGELVPLTW
ncbi:TIGR03936 family radical SAM-associated protein [Phytoactinopolyspora limicola]|uniref:TIGR03936 family radical SAM-associated protein n=1 Tax=Phytoactinopolyspora limicola TaxID=2715536 RepID=UPI00140856AC|nr:TIGR03936 family radical SAM-associated protein [Phytoactinopolyspora limicola]